MRMELKTSQDRELLVVIKPFLRVVENCVRIFIEIISLSSISFSFNLFGKKIYFWQEYYFK